MERWRLLVCLFATAALLAAAGCGGSASGEAPGTSAPEPLVVRRGELVDRFVLTGEVDANVSADITVPRLPSWQTSIQWLAEDGSEVAKGDRIAELDNSASASSLEEKSLQRETLREELEKIEAEAKAELAQKEFELESRQNDVEKARVEAEVPKEILSLRDWEDRQLSLKKAESEAEKARTLVESTRAAAARDRDNKLLEMRRLDREIEIAERAVETMTLRAPESGVLVLNNHPWLGRKVRTGDVVWVGFQFARIPDLSTLRITAWLPDVDDRKIESGMPVRVRLDAYPDVEMTGTIRTISPMAQEVDRKSQRRAFQTIVDLDDPDQTKLRPGLSARVEVIRRTLPDALLVPRVAVDFDSDKTAVRLAGGRRVEVEIVDCNATACAVTGDLDEGARLEPARTWEKSS